MPNRTVLATCLILSICLSSRAQGAELETLRQLSRIAGWSGADVNSPGTFKFVVVSDRTGNRMKGKWAEAIEQVNLLRPDFVVCIGDLIQGYTEDVAEINRQWDEFEALTRKFDAPFFYCPGNHDTTNDVMRKIYSERHGVKRKSYYSFDYRGCHFVVLSSWSFLLIEESREEQLAWLEKDLAAAKDAKHVFVFYHNPAWNSEQVWPRLRPLLPPGKTTIFNGHTHTLGYNETDAGVKTYVLGPTGTNSSGDRLAGRYRMFAHVTVDRGTPTVALIPVDELLPSDYAAFVTNVRTLSAGISSVPISVEGGRFKLRQSNPLPVAMTVDAQWEAEGWDISPTDAKFSIKPSATAVKEFSLIPKSPRPPRPSISVTYAFTNPYTKKQAQVQQKVALGTYATITIPRISGLKVDGKLDDFASVPPLRIGDRTRVFAEVRGWSGPDDNTLELRVATDGERLFLAADVTDDQIRIEHFPWRNDSLLFSWDARPPTKRTGAKGEGTGRVRLVVPREGEPVEPVWPSWAWPKEQPTPKGVRAVCKRRTGGYVYEWSIPLGQLGEGASAASGETMLLDVVCVDRDIVGGRPTVTSMNASGLRDGNVSTRGYVRCTFE